MNKKQLSKMLARRTCACVSIDHCCELLNDFLARIKNERVH